MIVVGDCQNRRYLFQVKEAETLHLKQDRIFLQCLERLFLIYFNERKFLLALHLKQVSTINSSSANTSISRYCQHSG